MKDCAGSILMQLERELSGDTSVNNEAYTHVGAGYRVIFISTREKEKKIEKNLSGVLI